MSPEQIRKFRKYGFIALGIFWLALVIPMFIGVFGGYNTDRVWDPYTGKALEGDDITRCAVDAELLLSEAETIEKLERRWELQARKWMVKCRKRKPDLYDKITRTRAHLIHPDT